MSTLRIAVATPFADRYSETFVAAHVQRLDRVDMLLSGSTLPLHVDGEEPFLAASTLGRVRDRIEATLRGGGLNALLAHRIARRLRQDRIAVVLAEYGTTGALMAPICRRAQVPLVVHFHGFDAYKTAFLEEHRGYRELFATAAAIVTSSAHMARHLITLGAEAGRVVVIPCGVDLERFTEGDPAAAPPHILAVGRFVPKKRMDDVLRAFQRVHALRPSARLTIVGDGPEAAVLRALSAELHLGDAVTFAGTCGHAEVAHHMRASRLLVQASATAPDGDREGTPVVVMEAMASGLPVVATRHAGIPEVVEHGVSGLLADERDVETLAAHMLDLLDHPEKARALGEAGRAAARQRLGVDAAVARLQQVLEGAASR